jgi:hypothetical protein
VGVTPHMEQADGQVRTCLHMCSMGRLHPAIAVTLHESKLVKEILFLSCGAHKGSPRAIVRVAVFAGAALTNFFIDPDPAHNVTLVFASQIISMGAPLDSPLYTIRPTIAKLAMDGLFGSDTAASSKQRQGTAL